MKPVLVMLVLFLAWLDALLLGSAIAGEGGALVAEVIYAVLLIALYGHIFRWAYR